MWLRIEKLGDMLLQMLKVSRPLNCDILCPDGDAPELPPLPAGRDAILNCGEGD